MQTTTELKFDHYRQLFIEARANRGQIRSSVATPVAASAFTVFNLGTLAQNFDVARALEPAGVLIGFLAISAVLALLAAVWCAIRVEWHFVHLEPPDLPEIVRIERQLRERLGDDGDQRPAAESVSGDLHDLLTGSYYVGYEEYLVGNARSARYRMWALRLVLLALACLAVAFLALPFHLGAVAADAAF